MGASVSWCRSPHAHSRCFSRWKLRCTPGYLSQSSPEQYHGGDLPKLSVIPEGCEERGKTPLATSLRKKIWLNMDCLYCQKDKLLLLAQKISHQPSDNNHGPSRCVANNSGEQDTETMLPWGRVAPQ